MEHLEPAAFTILRKGVLVFLFLNPIKISPFSPIAARGFWDGRWLPVNSCMAEPQWSKS